MSAKQLCLKRLAKEYANLQSSPIQGCAAAPLEDNILEWHANITTPRFQGIAFHFILKFPDDYPKMPPKVVPCHYIKHPNVFGDYICLDILTMAEETETSPYRGWSNAYTVSSLLVQLQAFLFDVERVDGEEASQGDRHYQDDYGIDRMYKAARSFKCATCSHWGEKPYPVCLVAGLNKPGMYRTNRPAILRQGAALTTPKVGEIPAGSMVQVVKFEGHRGCVVRPDGTTWGWCSKVTNNGVLLRRVFTSGPGVYKVNRKLEVAVGEAIVGEVPRGKYIDVLDAYEDDGRRLVGVVALNSPCVNVTQPVGDATHGEIYLLNTRFHEKFPQKQKQRSPSVSPEEQEEPEDYEVRLFVDDSNVLDILFTFCDPDTLHRICLVDAYFKKRIDQHRLLNEMNNRCYYTLKTMADEDTVIGVGLSSMIMDKRSRVTRERKPCLQQLHPTFDLLSAEAFYQHNCRTTVYKDCVFDSFLPLFINKAHGKRAMPAARKAIDELWKKESRRNRLGPKMVLDTLVKLMNTTVVDMMKTVMDLNVAEIQLYDSIKALEGYMAFHHLLLAFAQEEPKIVKIAEDRVGHFLTNAACRDKEVTPDVGELIVCLALSKYKWEEFIPKYIDEVFQRNARWILSEYPNLRQLEQMGTISCIRMRQSYDASKTGFRMAMFQRFFMKEIANPCLIEDHPDKLTILFEEYNARFGKPVAGLAEALQRHSRKVLACDNYFDFFELVGFCAPTAVGLCDWLRSSVKRSGKREYHSEYHILRYTEKHKVQPSCQMHMDDQNCMCCAGKVFQLSQSGKPILISDKKTQLDIAFVVDCTGSMYSWLEVAKEKMQKIVGEVASKTQFKRVRFAVVGYRDFGYEMGDWREPTLVKKFTDKLEKVQAYVAALRVGGGGDMEALSAGLAKAADLNWNHKAMKIIIHIGDQVPHGIGGNGDSYPDGEPDGSDALRTAHVLAKQGVVIYNVDCSSNRRYSYYNTSDSALRSTFYHALSVITNGTCVNISDADALSNIVLGAALEEQAQNKLAKLILPLYQDVLQRHEIGRFEQHVHQIYHKLKAAKVKVHTSMGVTEYPEHAEHQIDCITYCTDLKQAKAMARSEYFMDFDTKVNFSAAHTALVTEGQVRSCLNRIKDKAAEILFHQQGCSFRQKRWKSRAFKHRWSNYQTQGARKKLTEPWCAVRNQELRQYSRILEEAGKIASGEIKLKSVSGPVRGRKNPLKTAPSRQLGQTRAAPWSKRPQQQQAPRPAGQPKKFAWGQRPAAAPQQAPRPQPQGQAVSRPAPPQQQRALAQSQRSAPAQPQALSRPAPTQQQQRQYPIPQAVQQQPQQQRAAPVQQQQQQQRAVPPPAFPQQQRVAWGQQRVQAAPQRSAPTPQHHTATPVQQQQPQQRAVPQQRTTWGQQRIQAAPQRAAPTPQHHTAAPVQQQQQRRSPGTKRQAPAPTRQTPPRRRQSPVTQQANQGYVAPHRRSGSITRTSTYMGAHGPQSIRGSRSLSRDASRGQQQTRRSTSRDITRERPMPAKTMARNQSIPMNNQSVYQHQPVTQQHRPTNPVVQPVNPSCTVFFTNMPPTVSKAQFDAYLQHNGIPQPVRMGKDRANNLVWCTFAHHQTAAYVLSANLWVNGVKLNVTVPQQRAI